MPVNVSFYEPLFERKVFNQEYFHASSFENKLEGMPPFKGNAIFLFKLDSMSKNEFNGLRKAQIKIGGVAHNLTFDEMFIPYCPARSTEIVSNFQDCRQFRLLPPASTSIISAPLSSFIMVYKDYEDYFYIEFRDTFVVDTVDVTEVPEREFLFELEFGEGIT